MTELKTTQAEQPVKKVLKRGISNETRAVTRVKFHEKDCNPSTGLFVGHLESVSVEFSNTDRSQNFPNMDVPRITFHFESNHSRIAERRYYGHSLFPVESSIETIPNGSKAYRVDYIINTIKHFLDVYYLKGRELSEAEEDALTLDLVDYDEDGNYVPVDPTDVLNAYRKMFENAAAMLNGTFNLKEGEVAKPCYKTADGKIIPVWMKLLRHVKNNKGQWINVTTGGDLGFTGNPGSGLIELVNGTNPPAVLRINLAKESITPKNTEAKPIIGAPTAMPGTVLAGGVPQMGAAPSEAYNEAQGEMPF